MAAAAGEALARRVVRALREAGYTAYLVGGCVRDLLLGRAAEDFDVATSARPEAVLALFPNAGQVGAHFGVVLVREGEAQVEVATFRTDQNYRDGRRPEAVRFETDPRADVERRDFTINALMLDPETGEVLDFTGGQEDLRAGVIRAVGDPSIRFAEDHLRLIRAVRFAARLGFVIEPQTFEAVRRLASRIRTVAAERVRDELVRILTEGGARYGFELLDATGLLGEILPEVAAMKGVEQPPEFHPEGDVWVHTLLMLGLMERPTVTLALGVLLHDIAKPCTFRRADRIRFDGHAELGAGMAASILGRLRFSNDVVARVRMLVEKHLHFKDVTRMRESTLKRFLRMEGFEELAELHRLDSLASHRRLENYEFVMARRRELEPRALRPPRLVTGDDLIALGYRPGPGFRTLLEAVESAQLEGELATREEAVGYLLERFPPSRARGG